MRVAALTPFLMLKAYALHERSKLKDAYDIVFTIANWPGGPEAAAEVVPRSPVVQEQDVQESLALSREHFGHVRMDGPGNFSAFLAAPDLDENDEEDRRRPYAARAMGDRRCAKARFRGSPHVLIRTQSTPIGSANCVREQVVRLPCPR
jgi:hypothetical protein